MFGMELDHETWIVSKLIKSALEIAIGKQWDDELEPFRIALAERGQESLSQIG